MEEGKIRRRQKIYCLLLYIPCLFSDRILDNDIWFLLNSGRYVINKGVPFVEPFTIHSGMSFVMQQWLSAVIFWKVYDFAGQIGLNLLVCLFYGLFVFGTFKLSMLLSEGNFAVSFVVSFFVSCAMNIFMVERPHLFLFVIILSELYFLENHISTKRITYLIPLPVLSFLLVNLEAAMWPLLFVILIPYLIDSFKFKYKFVVSQGFGSKWIVLIILFMVACGAVNPYGLDAMTYLFGSYGINEINTWINEMKCADINSIFGKLIFGSIALVSFVFCLKKGDHRLRFYLLFLGTAYLALSSVRSFTLFIICGIIPMSYYFRNYKLNIEHKNDKKTLFIRWSLIVILICITVFAVVLNKKETISARQQELMINVEYLEKVGNKNVTLYTGYNDGGYLEFRGFKVYIDPRAEVFLKSKNKKEDVYIEYYQLQNGEIYYADVLNKYNFDYLLFHKNDILYNYLDHDSDYKLIHSTGNYKIYEHLK